MNIVVSGPFDDLKSPDIRFIQEASKFGPVTVLLWDDDSIKKITGSAPKFPEQERKYFLENVRYVHRVELVSIDNPNALPEKMVSPNTSTWVVRNSEHHPEKEAFASQHNIGYAIIRESDLKGFPTPTPDPNAQQNQKRVIVTGCYDWLHSGHIRFFEEASRFGLLFVGIGSDENIRLLKGPGHPMFPQEERLYMVASIKHVYHAFINSGHGWLDAEPEILKLKPDYYVVNEDGDRPEKRKFCQQHGINYVVLQRTPAPGLPKRSSTQLRGF